MVVPEDVRIESTFCVKVETCCGSDEWLQSGICNPCEESSMSNVTFATPFSPSNVEAIETSCIADWMSVTGSASVVNPPSSTNHRYSSVYGNDAYGSVSWFLHSRPPAVHLASPSLSSLRMTRWFRGMREGNWTLRKAGQPPADQDRIGTI